MAQVRGQLIQVQASDQLTHGLCTHTGAEDVSKTVFQLAVAVLLQQVHLLQPLQVTPQLLQTVSRITTLQLQLCLSRVNPPLVCKLQSLSLMPTLCLQSLYLMARLLCDIVARGFHHTAPCRQARRRYPRRPPGS